MIFFLGYFASGKSLPKIGNFNEMFEMERIIIKTSQSQTGDASIQSGFQSISQLNWFIKHHCAQFIFYLLHSLGCK